MEAPVFSVGMFPVGVSLTDDMQGDMPKNTLPAPQLVMLANVAVETAPESGGASDGSVADEKEMMELQTVGSSYSDSEDENVIRYSYDSQSNREVCIVEYPETPSPTVEPIPIEEQPKPSESPTSTDTKTSSQSAKCKNGAPVGTDGTQKKKLFCCKPCHFQAQNEQEFVEHLSTHSASKMMVVNQVEGRSKSKAKEVETTEAQTGGQGEGSSEAAVEDVKGLIRCERCGYNTNRYDHYIAHLKHHSKEGDDHRVFKCTLCAYTTVSHYHWRKHLRNHFPSKLHTCNQCSYFSDRKSNYIQHIRTHTGVRPFQCPYCDYSSSQKTHLTRHMRTHSGERPFKCDSCSYLAANQHEVTRHARQVHNGPKPLSCPYCEYKSADRSNFKKHVELHLNPRQFLCPLCKYAASKKCNLQYHIKSRHSGCDVDLDVSKVKLRIKKSCPESADENSDSKKSKTDYPLDMEEDMDQDEDEDSSPINLSVRKSSSDQPIQIETPNKTTKTSNAKSEKDNSTKRKEPEKRVTTRQKKIKNSVEIRGNKLVKKEATEGTNGQAKKRVKKLPTEKTAVQDRTEESNSVKHQSETGCSDPQPPGAVKELKTRPERKKAEKNGNKSLVKVRKSGSKRSEKTPEPAEEASVKPNSPERSRKVGRAKDKPAKRKGVEALDLSQQSSKAKRLKAVATENLQSKSDNTMTNQSSQTEKSTSSTLPVEKRKTRTSSKKASGLQPAVEPKNVQMTSITGLSVPQTAKAELTGTGPVQDGSSTDQPAPPDLDPSPSKQIKALPPSSSREDTLSEDQSDPAFLKPSPPPPPLLSGQRSNPADHEDDEGIHSSHEGGSDISDSASEGSDDSGLNGNGAGPARSANDPETPTDEIPTPTELKNHLCIFCDRTFLAEADYRRHLNRHLVNVYYLEATATR
uniref:RE1-silencing transcription factor n=1 Tax=Iconisemion striatum TaxID=60296 RepID=A0A1A7XD75_9TELE